MKSECSYCGILSEDLADFCDKKACQACLSKLRKHLGREFTEQEREEWETRSGRPGGADRASRGFSRGEEGTRYPVLRTIARLYQLCAWICLACGVVVGLILSTDARASFVLLVGVPVSSVMGCLTCLGTAEGIKVLLDIEENTRRASEGRGSD